MEIAGIAPVVNGLWMNQVVRNLTDPVDGVLTGKKYLIHDRDPLLTAEFLQALGAAGVKSVKLPLRLPNVKADCERLIGTIQCEWFGVLIPLNEGHLGMIFRTFVSDHNRGAHTPRQ